MTNKEYIKLAIELFDPEEASERINNFLNDHIALAKEQAKCELYQQAILKEES